MSGSACSRKKFLECVDQSQFSLQRITDSFKKLPQGFDDVFIRFCIKELESDKPEFGYLIEYVREKLNTGYWRDVPLFWRESYALIRLATVLTLTLASGDDADFNAEYIMWLLDDALIMGHSNDLGDVITTMAEKTNAFLYENSPRVNFPSSYSDISCKAPQVDSFCYSGEEISELPRVHQPSIGEFIKILEQGKPVVITGAMNHWPAINESSDRYWSPAYWSRIAGYRTVPIEVGSAYTDSSWGQRLVTVNQFFDQFIINPVKGQPLGYLAQHQILLQIPELSLDVDIPEYCYTGSVDSNSTTVDSNIWVGPANTVSPLHHDSDRPNIFCQLIGFKYVKFYTADQTEFIYPHVDQMLSNTSQIDVASKNPDFKKYPKFKQARGFHGVVGPGEMVFMPPRCWHYLRALTTSISMNFWFCADAKYVPPWPESYKM